MDYSKSVLLFRDKPKYGLLLKLILVIPVAFLVVSFYFWSSGEISGGLAFLLESFLVGLIFWFVFPREYQVFEDHIRITLGSPFSVKVGFQNIETIQTTSRTALTVNFVTRITSNYVAIVRKKGLNIAITPADSDSFVENANQALERWLITKKESEFIQL